MHVVQVLAALSLGGSELVAIELSEYLRKLGHQVTIIAADGPLRERALACGARHINWPIGKKRLSTLRLIKPLRQWLADNQPDVLHCHSRLPAWITYRALRKCVHRSIFITSMHGHYSVNPYSAVMAKGDRIIAVSDHIRRYTLQQYPHTPAENVVTIHGGVNALDFPHLYQPDEQWREQTYREFPALKDRPWLVLPGRITRWKGHIDFLHLLANLRAAGHTAHGLIIGPYRNGSSYFGELLKLRDQLQLADHITFTGPRHDMRNWYASATAVYNLSNNPPEAFGRTVLEALKTGTPVLAWDQAGPAEQLAALYPSGKIPVGDMQGLLDRTVELLHQRDVVPESDLFSLQGSMEKTLSVYQQALPPGSQATS